MTFKTGDIVQIKNDLTSFINGGFDKSYLGKFGRVSRVGYDWNDTVFIIDLYNDASCSSKYLNLGYTFDFDEVIFIGSLFTEGVQTKPISTMKLGLRQTNSAGKLVKDLPTESVLQIVNASKPLQVWQNSIRKGSNHPRVFQNGELVTILSSSELCPDLVYGGGITIAGKKGIISRAHSSVYGSQGILVVFDGIAGSYSVLESETVEFYQRTSFQIRPDTATFSGISNALLKAVNFKITGDPRSIESQQEIRTSGQGTSIKSGVSEKGSAIVGYIGKSDIRVNTTRSRKVISSNIQTIIKHGGSNRGSKIQSAHL